MTKPTQSILLTVKKMLGIAEEYHAFDIDIITNVNATFLTLNQLGVGPVKPFSISSDEEVWKDFLGAQMDYLQAVQTYVYLQTRLYFDPPTNSFLVDAMQKQIEELGWRFTVQPKTEGWVNYDESFKRNGEDELKSKDSQENQNGSDEPQNPTTYAVRRQTVKTDSQSPLDLFR